MAVTAVPNSASTYTAAACVPNSMARWAVLGFTPSVGASGSVMFWAGSALADGSPLLPIMCAIGQTYQSPVIHAPHHIIVASIAGGSAVVWIRAAC
jgi:hypothetical protein